MVEEKCKNCKYHKVRTTCHIRCTQISNSCTKQLNTASNSIVASAATAVEGRIWKNKIRKALTGKVSDLVEFTGGSYNEKRKLIAYLHSQRNGKLESSIINYQKKKIPKPGANVSARASANTHNTTHRNDGSDSQIILVDYKRHSTAQSRPTKAQTASRDRQKVTARKIPENHANADNGRWPDTPTISRRRHINTGGHGSVIITRPKRPGQHHCSFDAAGGGGVAGCSGFRRSVTRHRDARQES